MIFSFFQDVSDLGFVENCNIPLEVLDLSQNSLVSIPPKAFSQLSRLEVLRLDNNNINVLEDQACAGLVSLKKLSLANNQLVALPPELFSGNYFHAHRFYCQRNGLKPLISSDNQV